MASAKAVLNTLRPRAEATFDSLLGQAYEVLMSLPAVDEVASADVRKKASLATYRDILPDGRLRVVVQLVVRGMLGSARIWARGFTLRPGEATVHATIEEL